MAKRNKPKSDRRTGKLDPMSQKRDDPGETGGRSSERDLLVYRDAPGRIPLFDFLAERKEAERVSIRATLEHLRDRGHELRPPVTEHLGNRLYYLRVTTLDGTYRIFYWPFGKGIVVAGHGFSKKSGKCPPSEIERAERCRKRFEADPARHTHDGNWEEKD